MQEPSRPGHFIGTFTGRKFYVLDPRPEDIAIQDIAHALSMQCRYNGHVRKFYSVAEHSFLVSMAAQNSYSHSGTEDCLRALLHDAAEAYVGDLPSPIKRSVPTITEAEDRIESMIMNKFGLPEKMPEWLRELDQRITTDERCALMVPTDLWTDENPLEALGVQINGWSPEEAEKMFLFRYGSILRSRAKEIHRG